MTVYSRLHIKFCTEEREVPVSNICISPQLGKGSQLLAVEPDFNPYIAKCFTLLEALKNMTVFHNGLLIAFQLLKSKEQAREK